MATIAAMQSPSATPRRGPLRDLFDGLKLLRFAWRDALLTALGYQLVTATVLTPLVALLARGVFALTGRTTVANADLLAFLLSPLGLLGALLLACVAAVVGLAGLAAQFAVALAAAEGHRLRWDRALFGLLGAAPRLASLSSWMVLRALLTALPFLLALGALYLGLLGQHDINYYLSARPPEFWTALALGALVALALLWVLAHLLASWSLALPLVAARRMPRATAIARSRELTRQAGRTRTVVALAAGPALSLLAALLLGGLLTLLADLVLGELERGLEHGLRSTAAVLGVVAVLQVVLASATSIVAGTSAVCTATALWHAVAPLEQHEVAEHPPAPPYRGLTRKQLLLAIPLAAVAATLTATGLLADIESPDDVLCIAHRAGGRLGPENSLEALRRSIAAGADMAEIDVQRAADGVVVVQHDRDLMKTAGLPWRIADTPSERLCRPRDGSGDGDDGGGLTTLADFCRAAGDAIDLCVELKYYGPDPQLAPATLDVLRDADILHRTTILSLDASALTQVRTLAPEVKTGFLAAFALGGLTRLDVDVLAVADRSATTALVRDAHARDRAVYSWTLNTAAAISAAIDRGVAGVITDDPELFAEVVAERAELTGVERLLLRFAARR